MLLVELIYNLSVLVACSVLSNFIDYYIDRRQLRAQLIQGLLFGFIAIVGMLDPFVLAPGLIFDGRTVVISICALFFGPISGGIAAFLAILYRFSLGGPGLIMGITTSLEAFLVGTAFYFLRQRKPDWELNIWRFYLIGIIVHIIMLLLVLTLPRDLIVRTYQTISIAVLGIYPVVTVLIGTILLDQENNRRYLQAMREGLALYQTTLYSIGDGVIVTDAQGCVTHLNPVAAHLTGWTEMEAIGQKLESVFKIINEDTRRQVENPVKRVLKEGVVVGLANHTLLLARDGREIPITDSGAPIRDEEGQIVGVVLVFRDQTEERAHQRQIAQNEAKYRGLFYAINDGIALHELVFNQQNEPSDYRILEVNQRYHEILGLETAKVVGRLASEVYHQSPPLYLDIYARVALTGVPYTFEVYNEIFQKYFIISAFAPQKNQFATVFQDITERKRAELIQHIQYEIAHGGMTAKSLDEFYAVIQQELSHLIDTNNFYVAFYNEQDDTFAAIFEKDERDQIPVWPAANSLTGQVVKQNQSLFLTGDEIREWAEKGKIELIGTVAEAWLGVPLQVGSKVVGAMVIQHYTNPKAFNKTDLEVLETIATQVGLYLEKQRIQQQLKETNMMLQSILDTIPVRVFWKDKESRYLGCNLPFALDAGVEKPADLIGKDDFQLGWREQAELYRSDDQEIIRTGVAKLNYEEPQTTPNGKRIWLKTSKVPLRNAEGDIIGVLGTYEDITLQKQAEEQIRYQANLLQQVSDAIIATDNDSLIRLWSPSAERIYGWRAEEVLGKPFHEIIKPEYRYHSREEVFSQIAEKGSWSGEIIHHNREGRELTVISTISTVRDMNGAKSGLVSVNHDITERRRVTEALDLAVKSANVGLWEQDFRTGKIIRNEQWANMLGYTLSEIEPSITAFQELLHPDDRERFQQIIDQLNSGAIEEFRFEQRLRTKDGQWRWILNIGKVLERDAAKKPIRASGVHLDITEMKETEEKLRASESRMRAIVEGTPYLFFYIQDEEANTLYVSPSVESITGYPPEVFCRQRDWFSTANIINEYAKSRTKAHLQGDITPEPILVEVQHANGYPILLEIY